MPTQGTSKYFTRFVKGRVIGNWEVVDPRIIMENESKVLCRCKCGVEKLVSCYNLRTGKSKSCLGCSGRSLQTNPAWKGFGEIPGKYIGRIERRVIKAGYDYDLTPDFLQSLYLLQNKECALSGLPISFIDETASLDRIDSYKGYIQENVQWVHKDVNRMKNAFKQDYFLAICKRICENNKS